jgi:hypothetical protein
MSSPGMLTKDDQGAALPLPDGLTAHVTVSDGSRNPCNPEQPGHVADHTPVRSDRSDDVAVTGHPDKGTFSFFGHIYHPGCRANTARRSVQMVLGCALKALASRRQR